MRDPTIALLAELVSIDSVNPALVPGGAGETEIADTVARVLSAAGMDVETVQAAPGRPNVVGVLEGKAPGRSLILCGHLDTVGVEEMAAPFDPVERDGRLYGRGSQDMKGGLAAILGAARELASASLPGGRLIVAAVADEEHASLGADTLVKTWKADAAIVAEPTDLVVAVGHKGFSWVEIETLGRAAHGSRPAEGEDAILRMGRVLSRLEALERELQGRSPHPLLGTASLHASLIEGGRELSTYPDRCTLRLERRTVIGESVDVALSEAEAILASLRKEDPSFQAAARSLFGRPPYETPRGHPIIDALEAAMETVGRRPRRGGMTYWTDAAILGHAGIPSVVFGPGGEGLHGLEEYVCVDEVLACRAILAETARRFCAGSADRPRERAAQA
ncbi:MAG TPA: ArgE/DapE family deacylase [Thermoanaerobaculia bacterium]|jgi:acetylornithine deacetylase